MNIAQQSKEVAVIVALGRKKPALEEMSLPVPSPIECSCVAGQQPLHDPGYSRGMLPEEEMEMIRHEAIGVKLEPESLLGFSEEPNEFPIIVIFEEYRLLPIATGHGVVDRPTLGASEGACHILHTI